MARIDLPLTGRGPGRIDFRFDLHLGARRGSNRKPPRRKGGEPEREAVEPPRPKDLSGGAAVALQFDS